MKLIVITSPEFLPGEAFLIERLFSAGIDTLHLRKPGSSSGQCAALLDGIPAHLRSRIVIHDHFSLCASYALQGIHLNSRNPLPPAGLTPRTISASCHSVAEVAARKPGLDYVFLSPIFDSISKEGYNAAYSDAELADAAGQGIIDSSVYALGGIDESNLPALRKWNFGGCAVLGTVWQKAATDRFDSYVRQLADIAHG